jgi:hypothetical protein
MEDLRFRLLSCLIQDSTSDKTHSSSAAAAAPAPNPASAAAAAPRPAPNTNPSAPAETLLNLMRANSGARRHAVRQLVCLSPSCVALLSLSLTFFPLFFLQEKAQDDVVLAGQEAQWETD